MALEEMMFEIEQTSMHLDVPQTVESELVSLNSTDEIVVASEAGSFSCADVWFHVPQSWISRVTIRLYARLGSARVLLRQVALDGAAMIAEGDERSGIAVSVRGRPCDGFEVTCQANAPLSNGRFYLQAWHSAAEPSTIGKGTTHVWRNRWL